MLAPLTETINNSAETLNSTAEPNAMPEALLVRLGRPDGDVLSAYASNSSHDRWSCFLVPFHTAAEPLHSLLHASTRQGA